MNTQDIEYQGCYIELHDGGHHIYGIDPRYEIAHVWHRGRAIAAYGADIVDQIEAILDEAPFDHWYSIAERDERIEAVYLNMRLLYIDYLDTPSFTVTTEPYLQRNLQRNLF